MNRRRFVTALAGCTAVSWLPPLGETAPEMLSDIRLVPPDLATPPMEDALPTPGRRVRQSLPGFAATDVHHALYLPIDWQAQKKYPVIVEYPGNGPYTSPNGDLSSGDVNGCNLGYGISAGRSFIWLTLPCIDEARHKNQLWWWGNVEATLEYCRKAVSQTCEQFGGDSASVILCGFSRGSIACSYLGLYDDMMADIWLAFIACSHYDGVRAWDWQGSDRPSAKARLARTKGRACFIAQEVSTKDIQDYLGSLHADARFTFQDLHFPNHTDAWVLRDIPERRALRSWLAEALKRRTGTHSIHGKVLDSNGNPLQGAKIESGPTHSATTIGDGTFALGGLINGLHVVRSSKPSYRIAPSDSTVTIANEDVLSVNFSCLK